MDVTDIARATTVTALDAALASCRVVPAVIGPQWPMHRRTRRRRLDDPGDYLRIEIAHAPGKGSRHPVLVRGARMLAEHELPDD
jgi:hypothetical protein